MICKNIFIDSDIILDVFIQRDPYYSYAQKLLNKGINSEFKIHTSALVIANIYYITAKALGKNDTKDKINKLLKMLTVLPLDTESISLALNSNFNDMEDAMQHFVALRNECDLIITRNLKHYKKSLLPVMTAEQFIRKF
ncbi:type II toxin-antitoxin system VapC family toxin [Daejeonella sp.]|uniref:type II toxin-antitoxin system VapC family toxin n=1 Tax=Daejeonella sp. TaxID=2805397 RepID=UPI00398313CF